MVKGLPEERTIALAHYMVDSGATVRQAAARFGVSKSTVHKDITTRLKRQNAVLYAEVQAVLLRNKSERHIRGGNATRDKYREEAQKGGQLLRVHRARKTKPAAQKGSRFRRFEKGQLRAAK